MQQHNMEHSDIKELEKKINNCGDSILTFEEAIEKEQATIKEYRGMISDPSSKFSEEALENGILGCKKNIAIFEEAIENENNSKKELRFMIEKIREKEHIEKLQKEDLTIDAKDIM